MRRNVSSKIQWLKNKTFIIVYSSIIILVALFYGVIKNEPIEENENGGDGQNGGKSGDSITTQASQNDKNNDSLYSTPIGKVGPTVHQHTSASKDKQDANGKCDWVFVGMKYS